MGVGVSFEQMPEWRAGWLARFSGAPRDCPFDANGDLERATRWCRGFDEADEAMSLGFGSGTGAPA